MEKTLIKIAELMQVFNYIGIATDSDANMITDKITNSGRSSFFLISPLKLKAARADLSGLIRSTYSVQIILMRKHSEFSEKDAKAIDKVIEMRREAATFMSGLYSLQILQQPRDLPFTIDSNHHRNDANMVAVMLNFEAVVIESADYCFKDCLTNICDGFYKGI